MGAVILGGIGIGSALTTGGDVGEGFFKGVVAGSILGTGIGAIGVGIGIGATTTLGSLLTTTGIAVTSNLLEVAITQGKKNYSEGHASQITNNIIKAMFANSWDIVVGKAVLGSIAIVGIRTFSKIPLLANYIKYTYAAMLYTNDPLSSVGGYWSSKIGWGSIVIGYGLAELQVFNLVKTIFGTPNYDKWILY